MIESILENSPLAQTPFELMAEEMINREFVKEWTIEDFSQTDIKQLSNRDFDQGRNMFSVTGCFACHRFNNEGGMTGPDLTSAGRRFSVYDLLDNIINPSKVMNDQYAPVQVTMENGELLTGLIVNLDLHNLYVNIDMFNPNDIIIVDRNKVSKIEMSPLSPMPSGLLSILKEDEILDLIAFIISGGKKDNAVFRR